MPSEEAIFRKGLAKFLRRVEHHFDHALDVAVGRCQRANVDAKPARDR
jgi:hypothetical protein